MDIKSRVSRNSFKNFSTKLEVIVNEIFAALNQINFSIEEKQR
jgi:hypothetical protein